MAGWIAALSVALAIVACGRPAPAARLTRLAVPPGAAAPPHPRPPPWGRGAPGDARGALRWVAVAMIGSLLVAARVPVPVLVSSVAAVAIGLRVRRSRRELRRREACAAATIEVTVALAGELRAGRTPSEALRLAADVAGPLAAGLLAAAAATEVGAAPADELAEAARTPGAERLASVAGCWAVAVAAGGRVADTLDRLAEAMDADDELRRELDSALAGPKATMVLLGGLPLLGIALGQSVGAGSVQLLVHRPLGWALLGAAGVLDAVGVVLTRTIARVALRR